MRFPIEGLHTETGPGVIEAALTYCDALEAADRAALFKTFAKVLAQRHGLMATFMAKWSNSVPGQSGHLHISLRGANGESVFHDPSKPHDMSDAMRWFVGGQQALMPELLGDGRLHGQQLLAPGTRILGADLRRPGESRTAPRRCASSAAARRASASNTGSRPRTSILISRSPRPLAPGCGASSIASSRMRAIEGNAYDREHPAQRRLPATLYEAAERLLRSETGARAVWRRVRRALRRNPPVGRAGIPQGDHRLGTRPLFRDHLSHA